MIETDDKTDSINGYPDYFITNDHMARRLWDEDNELIETFRDDATGEEIRQFLRGWLKGRELGKRIGRGEVQSEVRRALGID